MNRPCARDILSDNIVLVQAESRLGDVQARIGNSRVTHALVYDGEDFCGVVPLNIFSVAYPQRIFADLLPRVPLQMIPDSAPLEMIVSMLQNSGRETIGVVNAEGNFTGIISREGLLRALLKDAWQQLEEFDLLKEKEEKFRIIGQMASGITHDLNNILAAVIGNLELLDLIGFSSEDEKEILHIALTATQDAANAVDCLQKFYHSNGISKKNEICDLSAIAKEVKQFTKPRWVNDAQKNGKTIKLELDLSSVPPVRGNPGEIREVLTNLVINAIDAIAETGIIRMHVYKKDRFVFVDVTDSGAGMDEEQRLHCFKPFYTTKVASGPGNGLGLFMSLNIMEKHGGHIEFETGLGKGTTFRVSFPASTKDA